MSGVRRENREERGWGVCGVWGVGWVGRRYSCQALPGKSKKRGRVGCVVCGVWGVGDVVIAARRYQVNLKREGVCRSRRDV